MLRKQGMRTCPRCKNVTSVTHIFFEDSEEICRKCLMQKCIDDNVPKKVIDHLKEDS